MCPDRQASLYIGLTLLPLPAFSAGESEGGSASRVFYPARVGAGRMKGFVISGHDTWLVGHGWGTGRTWI